jgi:SAM-dependent methyltransferase
LEIYLPPIIGTEKFYKELQGDVTLNYYRDDKWDFKEALKYIADSDSIIEIGCGPGYFLEKVKPYVKKTCGIDSNNSALQFARNNGLEVYDLETDMKSFWSTFDVVFSFHVLEHVSDPVGFIRDISLYAKPGGKICISVPNQDGPIRNIPNSLQNMPPHHATHWRLKTLKKLAEKSNLRITKIAYEPLLLENHNYYSHYWISSIFSEGTKLSKIAKRGGSKILSLFFQLLIGLKFKSFLFLKGQAILIVMEKTGS